MEAATPLMNGTNINPKGTATVVSQEDNTLTIRVTGLQTEQLNDTSQVEPNHQTQKEDQYQTFFPKKTIMGLSISLLVVGILSMIIQVHDLFTGLTLIITNLVSIFLSFFRFYQPRSG